MRIVEQPQLRKLYEIITASLVEWLREQNFPMPQPPIRFYPDGSLWTDDYSVLQWHRKSLIGGRVYRDIAGVEQFISEKLPGAYMSACFRPLAPFGGDRDDAPQYNVLYPGSCYKWMGEHEHGALMYPGVCKKATEDEYDLSRVRVLIRLRRKFTQAMAGALAGVVRQWFAEIGSKGVFGEACVASVSPTMRYLERCAGFELDARGSGKETLNTLYLAVLNWGIDQRRPLVLTDLAADRNEPVFTSNLSISLE